MSIRFSIINFLLQSEREQIISSTSEFGVLKTYYSDQNPPFFTIENFRQYAQNERDTRTNIKGKNKALQKSELDKIIDIIFKACSFFTSSNTSNRYQIGKFQLCINASKVSEKWRKQWEVSIPGKKKPIEIDDANSDIKKSLRAAYTALQKNNHNSDTEGRDWIAAISFYQYLEKNNKVSEFRSYLAQKYGLYITGDADSVLNAIFSIITWQGDELRKKNQEEIDGSFIRSLAFEAARNANFDSEDPATKAFFEENEVNNKIKVLTQKIIFEIENEAANDYANTTFNKILDKKISDSKNAFETSILNGIKLSRSNRLIKIWQSRDDEVERSDSADVKDGVYINIIIRTVAMYAAANETKRRTIIEQLKNDVSDFSSENRKRQECAALTIACILFEKFELEESTRNELFKLTFGKLSYNFMNKIFRLLNEQANDYYKNIITEKYKEVINSDTRVDPLYFFFYHFCGKKSSGNDGIKPDFFTMYEFRYKTWTQQNPDVNDLIKNANDIKITLINRTDMSQKETLYAVQSYFYGLSNIAMLNENGKAKVKALFNDHQEGPNLIKMLLLADYRSRLSVFGSLDGDKLDDFIAKKDFYLLCGPTRVVCSLTGTDFEKLIKIDDIIDGVTDITRPDFIKNYKKWLTHENGRYKILLSKLLSLIEEYDAEFKPCLENSCFFNDDDFRPYDHISAIEINKMLIELKSSAK